MAAIGVINAVNYWILSGPMVIRFRSENQLIRSNIQVKFFIDIEFGDEFSNAFSYTNLDYLQIVDTPMDLRTVKEELLGCNYEAKSDFLKDVRMIFTNSRSYNTNPLSRVSLSFFFC